MTETKNEDVLRVYGESGKTVYDSFMEKYFGLLEESTQQAYGEFFNKLGLKPGDRVLEVGFGTGSNMQFYPADINLVGMDLTPEMLETAKNRARELGRENVECIVGSGDKIPYEDGSFDAVTSTFTLCVTEEPQKVLFEMIRVCKEDGFIGVFDYKKANSNSAVLKDQILLNDSMRQKGIYHGDEAAVVFNSLSDLDALVRFTGLKIVDEKRLENSFVECVGSYVLEK